MRTIRDRGAVFRVENHEHNLYLPTGRVLIIDRNRKLTAIKKQNSSRTSKTEITNGKFVRVKNTIETSPFERKIKIAI